MRATSDERSAAGPATRRNRQPGACQANPLNVLIRTDIGSFSRLIGQMPGLITALADRACVLSTSCATHPPPSASRTPGRRCQVSVIRPSGWSWNSSGRKAGFAPMGPVALRPGPGRIPHPPNKSPAPVPSHVAAGPRGDEAGPITPWPTAAEPALWGPMAGLRQNRCSITRIRSSLFRIQV